MPENTVTIASVYWSDLKATREFWKAGTTPRAFISDFRIPAVKRKTDPPNTIIVPACYQHVNIGGKESRENWQDKLVLSDEQLLSSANPYLDSAKEVARDLISEWTHTAIDAGDRGGPGIWVCAGDYPTEEEIKSALRRQSVWALYICALADKMWFNNQRLGITDFYRNAAKWLGNEGYEWVNIDTSEVTMKTCPLCGKMTPVGFPVCQGCNMVHDQALMRKIQTEAPKVDEKLAELSRELGIKEDEFEEEEKKTQLAAL